MLAEDFLDEIEKRFAISKNETEREALLVLLEKEYKRISNLKTIPEGFTMEILHSKKLRDTPEEIQFQFNYIADVIDSCKNIEQLESCRRMVDNFAKKYSNMTHKSSDDFHISTARSCLMNRIEKVRIQNGIVQ